MSLVGACVDGRGKGVQKLGNVRLVAGWRLLAFIVGMETAGYWLVCIADDTHSCVQYLGVASNLEIALGSFIELLSQGLRLQYHTLIINPVIPGLH